MNEKKIIENQIKHNKAIKFILNYLEKDKELKEKLHLENCFFSENPQLNGSDIFAILEDDFSLKACFDIEVQNTKWKEDSYYPYEFVNCSNKKEYMWNNNLLQKRLPKKMHTNKKIINYYIILNKVLTKGIFISGEDINKYMIIPKFTNKRKVDYIKIPLDKFIKVNFN